MKRPTLREYAQPRSGLALFLRFLRQRIDPEVRDLGSYARLPRRVGKRVTQEEIAEVVGVSREWYAVLESAGTTRSSTGLVNRLADALMVTPDERVRLFHLAVPALATLSGDSIAVLAAFSRLRSLSRRLWTATSVEDVLTRTSEQIADWFGNSVLVGSGRRRESGVWEFQALDETQDGNDASTIIRDTSHLLRTSESIDAAHLYPQLANPGDVGGQELHPPSLQRDLLNLYASRRLAGFTFLKARLRSRTGLIASFSAWHEVGHSYSVSDRAVLGTCAECASLALS
jgi:transcriptional regulator with XRE-family HTH domain